MRLRINSLSHFKPVCLLLYLLLGTLLLEKYEAFLEPIPKSLHLTSSVDIFSELEPHTRKDGLLIDENKNITKKYDPILDWKPPSSDIVQKAIQERVEPLRRLSSPKFFSTDKNGKCHVGLSHLPPFDERPLLIVGNHQLGGVDMWMVVAELLEQRDISVRGLGHSVIFKKDSAYFGGGPSFVEGVNGGAFGLFQTFGAVEASPLNFYRLMETKQAVLHFPGGVKEAYHAKGEEYELFWPINKTDFVRTAAKFNATIVTLASIGAADSAIMLASPDELLNLPFGLGHKVAESPIAVNGIVSTNDGNEYKVPIPPPLAIPKPFPSRHYFLFGKPISTRDLDPNDRTKCQSLYDSVQVNLRCGIHRLLQAREKDPFKNSVTRFAYEQFTKKSSPTFSIDELNV